MESRSLKDILAEKNFIVSTVFLDLAIRFMLCLEKLILKAEVLKDKVGTVYENFGVLKHKKITTSLT